MSNTNSALFLRFSDQSILADNNEPSRYIHASSGKLVLLDGDGNEIEVGMFQTLLVDVYSAVNDNESVWDVFNSESTTQHFYENLYDLEATDNFEQTVLDTAFGKDNCGFQPNLAIIDRLVVYSAWRGQNFGALAIQGLIQRLRASASLVAIKPFPLQFESEYLDGPHTWDDELSEAYQKWQLDNFSDNQEEATARLSQFYAKQGFRNIQGTDYWVRNIE
ncbi:hypothetical protein JBO49_15975 [Serratia fonticola]|uniref:hypothetical protein n=1 Tax=Serratia fonticola TaxID=47917 RepID=UPI00192BDA62|nr:hypothetical protein [Serratia fonticola]MBL5862115.1 hypothetical protein [Serratia fonticola]